jgi:putative flippase GtrA
MTGNGTLNMKPAPAKVTFVQKFHQHEHVLKYLLIGGTASAIDVALFMALFNLFDFNEWQSHSISVPVAVLFSFATNARHNFRTSDHLVLRLMSFSLICLLGFFVGYGVIETGRFLGADSNIGKLASLPVVFILQYLLNSRITFRKTQSRPPS